MLTLWYTYQIDMAHKVCGSLRLRPMPLALKVNQTHPGASVPLTSLPSCKLPLHLSSLFASFAKCWHLFHSTSFSEPLFSCTCAHFGHRRKAILLRFSLFHTLGGKCRGVAS